MRRQHLLVAVIGNVLLSISPAQVVEAAGVLWIQSSGSWHGIDGNWSSFTFAFGTPPQPVDLFPSTYLSDIWVVEINGCNYDKINAQECYDARGGVFNISASSTWEPLGEWTLSLEDVELGGNGDYGLDTLSWTNNITGVESVFKGALVTGINSTDYYQGYLGLGMTQSRLGGNETAGPFVVQLTEEDGKIPSYSYGFTAGASYVNGGTVASLTMGGYDKLRLESHNTIFAMDPSSRIPSVLLRGITATVQTLDAAPTSNWTATELPLVTMDDHIRAVIDSSTPYLWLPPTACDRFAAALNLVWNQTYGVYLFRDGDQYTDYVDNKALSFVFSLSSYDDGDDFGEPLETEGVVNITVSNMAFANLFRYPFRGLISFGDSAVPYFPLRRSNGSGDYIIGRSFLQEAYMTTLYDDFQLGIYQAKFPLNAASNYSVETLYRPADSLFPAYNDTTTNTGRNETQIKGIAVGTVLGGGFIIGLLLWFYCRRRRQRNGGAGDTEGIEKETDSIERDVPRSPARRMLWIITRKKKTKAKKAQANPPGPAEIGADANHAVYELPAPSEPVELESNHDIADDATEFGTEESHVLSAYEVAHRKMSQQLLGPLPSYLPPTSSLPGIHEKSTQDVSPVSHHRPPEDTSPASSPTYATSNSNSLTVSLPSPLTPHPDWPGPMMNLPSPLTIMPPPFPSPPLPTSYNSPGAPRSSPTTQVSRQMCAPSSLSLSSSSNVSPVSPGGPILPPSAPVQRGPIDPSRVVCLGPLSNNVRLSRQSPSIPQLVAPDGRLVVRGSNESSPISQLGHDTPERSRSLSGTNASIGTLGGNFITEEERQRLDEIDRHLSLRQLHAAHSNEGDYPRSPQSMERIEAGAELVHVPQVAARRYSWEESREDP